MSIRPALPRDIPAIYSLLRGYAEKELLLPRSFSELYDSVRDFLVAEEEGQVIGTAALHVTWEGLAELRSLAVAEGFTGRGIGRTLAGTCLADADRMGIQMVFVLTYVPEFFRKLGFRIADKSELPHKVWGDCVKCVKFPDCDEAAMIWEKQVNR
ncbi:MAG: N-acetyltransferase [Nitrospirota bacterium]